MWLVPFQEEMLGLGLYPGEEAGCTCKNSKGGCSSSFVSFKIWAIFFFGGGYRKLAIFSEVT